MGEEILRLTELGARLSLRSVENPHGRASRARPPPRTSSPVSTSPQSANWAHDQRDRRVALVDRHTTPRIQLRTRH